MTDSSTVRAWASLELVPLDMSRRIIRLKSCNFCIVYIESRLNASNWITHLDSGKPTVQFRRFLEDGVVNADSEALDWKDLFCDRKFEEATGFFQRSRRQNLPKASCAAHLKNDEGDDDDEDDKRVLIS